MEDNLKTKVEVVLKLDKDQFDKFADFLAWLKEDRELKSKDV